MEKCRAVSWVDVTVRESKKIGGGAQIRGGGLSPCLEVYNGIALRHILTQEKNESSTIKTLSEFTCYVNKI